MTTPMTNIKLKNHIQKTLSIFSPRPLAAKFSGGLRKPTAEFHSYKMYIDEGATDDVEDTILKRNPEYKLKDSVIIVVEDRQFIYLQRWMGGDGCVVTVTGLNPNRKSNFNSIYD